MRIVQVNAAYEPNVSDPEALLDRYEILTGWSDALLEAGAGRVAVVQRFVADVRIVRRGVEYLFCADSYGPQPARYRRLPALYQIAAGWQPDVVHVNGLNAALHCYGLRRALPLTVAIAVQDHAGETPQFAGGVRALVRTVVARRGLAAADGFLFTAQALAQPWIDAGLIEPSQPVVEVPATSTCIRPIDRIEARRLTGISGDPALLWVGRLAAVKDPLTVLTGFSLALAHLPGATLTMVHNGGELEDQVAATIAATPALAPRVTLVSNVPRVRLPAFFSAADLFVLGSRHEACGLALIEALACGATPVVPAIPAFEALTACGSVGVLWPAGDAAGLARALESAAAGEAEARRAAAIAHFKRALKWRRVGRLALEAYETLVRSRTSKAGRSRGQ